MTSMSLKSSGSKEISGPLSTLSSDGYVDRSRHDIILLSYSDDTYSDAEQRQYGFYDLETDGALRGGGKLKLMTRCHFGLLLNYAGIGLMYGALPSTILPLMKYYLQMESYQVQAASSIVNTAWSFKTFGGILSDSFPIFGYRRKSYMVIGWVICAACLLSIGLIPMPEPYFFPKSTTVKNENAKHHGWMYALTMAGATFGYFFVNVASDGMVVEIAQREPMHTRGETQTLIYATRSMFMTVANIFIGTAFNDAKYGGTFSWSLEYNIVMRILACCAVIPLLGSIFLLHEDKSYHRMSFHLRCSEMWRIAQTRAVWQVLAFELIAAFCLSFGSSASASVATIWAKVEPFHRGIANLVTGVIYTGSLYITKVYLLQISWVKAFCVTTVWIVFIRLIFIGSTIFDIVRNQFFWFYMQSFIQPASAVRFLLFTFPITEIAEVGYEGTTFGLVTTFHNMAIPLGVSASKSVGSYFNINDKRVRADDLDIRWTVFYTYLIAWTVQCASMLSLFLLPRQRLEIQQVRHYGGHSRVAGFCVLLCLAFILLYSTITNAMSLFKSTSCYRVAGGNGC